MLAVVYSGSRYAEWKLADKNGIIAEFRTTGINPFFNDQKYILQILHKKAELINYAERVKRIYFFGAGASSEERKNLVFDALSQFFKYAKVVVNSDLQAAAIATCHEQPGIAGIIGSGSTAGCFDGKRVKPNNFGLGYILGDEGSANWLGRQLLKAYLYDELPNDFKERFTKKYDLNRKEILDKVYKQQQPTLFLSSFADFLLENREEPFVKQLVCRGFELYMATYILPIKKQSPDMPIYIVGTVASNFGDWLLEVASDHNLHISSVIKEPIYNLLTYYLHKTI
jgi:N-acetylglucosamine kinase-like BadF-type ATPase